jgi:hypothetical protein
MPKKKKVTDAEDGGLKAAPMTYEVHRAQNARYLMVAAIEQGEDEVALPEEDVQSVTITTEPAKGAKEEG